MVSDDVILQTYLRTESLEITHRETGASRRRIANLLAAHNLYQKRRKKLPGIMKAERRAKIAVCWRCGHVHVFPTCEWCTYLFRVDDLTETCDEEENRKPKKARRSIRRQGHYGPTRVDEVGAWMERRQRQVG